MADRAAGHEPSAIAVGRVLGVGATVAIVVITVVVLLRVALEHWVIPDHARVVARRAAIPPAPRLQPHPDEDLAALRAQQQRLLSNWAWADSTHEFAHIPIERAMQLYIEQYAATTAPSAGAPRPQDHAP